ncbi:GNAT family N-acetyltransferase [Virgibacillus xinjiangensis]|uniref:GNAT family N-acetyltransferase n=1 Tax=Virgibacillus xinjiangensis TaxID=393090 RepID=A0ABV7CVU0_9BACI
MDTEIRILTEDDYPFVKSMETELENDYVPRIFDKLSQHPNRMFGLFKDGGLVSISGYSIYAGRYAMLGRLRSHTAYKGNGNSTRLMRHMLDEVFHRESIQWVGANTQENNFPAQRVIEKTGLTKQTVLHGAVSKDVSRLHGGHAPWNRVSSLYRKMEWVEKAFLQAESFFPYECYYPFPATKDLFSMEVLQKWNFHENEEGTRMVITNHDQKKNHYLHAVYPWKDLNSQPGLWATISSDYKQLKKRTGEDNTYIWVDMTKEQAKSLPEHHPFELPSPWILYGMDKQSWENQRTGYIAYK